MEVFLSTCTNPLYAQSLCLRQLHQTSEKTPNVNLNTVCRSQLWDQQLSDRLRSGLQQATRDKKDEHQRP